MVLVLGVCLLSELKDRVRCRFPGVFGYHDGVQLHQSARSGSDGWYGGATARYGFYNFRQLDCGADCAPLAGYDENAPVDIVLYPQPSPVDPNDPLRWPRWKKHVAFASVCAFTFLTNFAIGGLAPAFYILSIEFDKSMDETSHLLLYPILVLGAFNFFWVPVANYVGKRPVFVFASALLCACYVWGAMANSFQSLLWSNIIAAFAGSSTEALGAATVNDLYFLHERGSKMGIYMNAIAGGNTLGPLICGFIVTNLSWRWHKWIAVILTALNFLTILLFVPETRYTREEIKGVGVAICPSSDKIVMADEKYLRPKSSNRILHQHAKNTWTQELSLWSGVSDTSLPKMFLRYLDVELVEDVVLTSNRPFPMIVYPAVIYAFLCYSISLVLTVAVNILNPFVLQAPPYSWSPQINGLINIPGIVGNLIGAWAGGEQPSSSTMERVLTEARQSRGHLVQATDTKNARNLRARKQALSGCHPTRDHNSRLSRVRLRCAEPIIMGIALLRVWHDFTRLDCRADDHNGVCQRLRIAGKLGRPATGERAKEHCGFWLSLWRGAMG